MNPLKQTNSLTIGTILLLLGFAQILMCQDVQSNEITYLQDLKSQLDKITSVNQLKEPYVTEKRSSSIDFSDDITMNDLKKILLNKYIQEAKLVKRARKQLISSGLQGVWGIPGRK